MITILEQSIFRIVAAEHLGRFADLRIANLDATAVKDWKKQWLRRQEQKMQFDWDIITDSLSDPNMIHPHFGWAFYTGHELCGLVSGYNLRSTFEKDTSLNIENIQGSPELTHPLKGHVIEICLKTAEAMGKFLGYNCVRVHRPKYQMRKIYERKGYSFLGYSTDCNFFEKKLTCG